MTVSENQPPVVEPNPQGDAPDLTLRALAERIRQQEILGELGVLSLQHTSFGELLDKTAQLAAEGLQADHSKVMVLAFLQGAANILGMAIERRRYEQSLKLSLDRQRLLARELNHRVKNSLSIVSSVLSLQANASGDDENLKRHLEEASSRVATIARSHERFYQTNDAAGEITLK